MQSVPDKLLVKSKKAARCSLYFPKDFLHYGSVKAVSKALERLVKDQSITREPRRIYARFENDPLLGLVKPGAKIIPEAISRRGNYSGGR